MFKGYYRYRKVKPDMSIKSTKKVKIDLNSHTLFTIFKTRNPHMQKI